MDDPQMRFPRNLHEEAKLSWTASALLAVIIIFCCVPAALAADWLKPMQWVFAFLDFVHSFF